MEPADTAIFEAANQVMDERLAAMRAELHALAAEGVNVTALPYVSEACLVPMHTTAV